MGRGIFYLRTTGANDEGSQAASEGEHRRGIRAMPELFSKEEGGKGEATPSPCISQRKLRLHRPPFQVGEMPDAPHPLALSQLPACSWMASLKGLGPSAQVPLQSFMTIKP